MQSLSFLIGHKLFPWIAALTAALIVAMALVPAIRRLLNALANLHFEARAMKKAMSLRQPPAQVRVRQTDLVGGMNRGDRASYRRAEELLARGQVVEAAWLFESIRFQRRAIDELEKAKLIDEACAVLLRMNVPHRAAVIYERNGMLQKAAHYFEQANQHDQAARVLLRLGRENWRCIGRAGELYAAGGRQTEAIGAFSLVLATDRVVAHAFQHGLFDGLLEYMADPVCAREVVQRLDEPRMHDLLRQFNESPRAGRILATWAAAEPDPRRRAAIAERARRKPELAQAFAAAMDPAAREAHAGGAVPRVASVAG